MKTYQTFVFEGYEFDQSRRQLFLNYSLDGELKFTETLHFQFEFAADFDRDLLDKACFGLLLAGGVSYYKAALPPQVEIKDRGLTATQASFFTKLYRLGLGEFLARNQISPDRLAVFPVDPEAEAAPREASVAGTIVPIGGGKDSLTTMGILSASNNDFATWAVNHFDQLQPQIVKVGKTHLQIERQLDPRLFELNAQGAHNGHVPISAYLAFAAIVTAVLMGKKDIVLSNEASAGEGNLTYEGLAVNHQYSKTLEFERDFQEYVTVNITPSIRYFSFLRPVSELHIAQLFCSKWLRSYTGIFSSCNRNWTLGHDHSLAWCGKCPKCAFVYLIFAPFVPKSQLVDLFGGKSLFEDPDQEDTFKELLGTKGHKPFECVGEVRECRQAVLMARNTGEYPELGQDRFNFPDFTYDYLALQDHAMPEEFYRLLRDFLDKNPA